MRDQKSAAWIQKRESVTNVYILHKGCPDSLNKLSAEFKKTKLKSLNICDVAGLHSLNKRACVGARVPPTFHYADRNLLRTL